MLCVVELASFILDGQVEAILAEGVALTGAAVDGVMVGWMHGDENAVGGRTS